MIKLQRVSVWLTVTSTTALLEKPPNHHSLFIFDVKALKLQEEVLVEA